ncbi:MAG: hypothetical protein Q9227_002657 [Pyrenula ochraceoflavens]
MADSRKNAFLDVDSTDEDRDDQGYDSEAAEASKGGRSITHGSSQPLRKKRKLAQSEEDEDASDAPSTTDKTSVEALGPGQEKRATADSKGAEAQDLRINKDLEAVQGAKHSSSPLSQKGTLSRHDSKSGSKKSTNPGVVYLSALPPYLKPSALRTLFLKRGFGPINRLFLTPASTTSTSTSRRNKRQTYAEGWIEFASKKTAKIAVETMNARTIGGKKGGFYHDDLLNMRYLKGMKWDDLMAQFREEKREEEVRQEAEREQARKETKAFMEGVERSKVIEGMERKRKGRRKRSRDQDAEGEDNGTVMAGTMKRNWEQFEAKNLDARSRRSTDGLAERVLGQIF